ncbi:MAG: DUF882 domain-containing protein [Beijerinckiaceae bacterium]
MLRALLLGLTGAAVVITGVTPTQDAVANGGTRSLTIYHAHTKEQETITYKSYGSFSSAGLQKLNWMLRDWRQDEATRMDPHLFDILWEVYRASGSSAPIHVVSAYRSPGTNAMLRRRSRGVAKNSQHMTGKAVDFNFPDVNMSRVRDIGLRLQNGGVGYYPRANNPWVHLDTGGVRHWPKVTRDHLVRLFPNEQTVHIPSDGRPLAGFETARATIESRGGSVSSGYIDIAEGRATGKTLFQILFGGGEGDDEDVGAKRGGKRGTAVASRQRNQQVAAVAPSESSEGSTLAFFTQNNATTSTAARTDVPAAIRSRPTRPTPVQEPEVKAAPPETKREEPKREEEAKQVEVAALAPKAIPAPAFPKAEATKADDEEDGKRVNIPLPPRRPANLVPAGPVLVSIPLPPRRPAVMLAAAEETEKPEATVETQPAKPVQVAALGKAVNIPLPPQRPAQLASLAAVGLRTQGAAPAATVTAYAPAPAAPAAAAAARIVPAAPVQAAPAQSSPAHSSPAQTASVAPAAVDRKGMNSLVSQISAASSTERGNRVAPTSVTALTGLKTVSGKFETATPEKTEAKGFSGSVIRPMGGSFKREN